MGPIVPRTERGQKSEGSGKATRRPASTIAALNAIPKRGLVSSTRLAAVRSLVCWPVMELNRRDPDFHSLAVLKSRKTKRDDRSPLATISVA